MNARTKKKSPLLEQAALVMPKDVEFLDLMDNLHKVTNVEGEIPYSVALKSDHADKYVIHVGVRRLQGSELVWTTYRMDVKGQLTEVKNDAA